MKKLEKSCSLDSVCLLGPLLACLCALSQPVLADDFVWELMAPSTNWDGVLNWSGTANEFPDDNTDSATVTVDSGTGTAPVQTSNRVVGALTLSGGGDLNTGNGSDNFALTVQESLFQDGTTLIEGSNSTLNVWQSPALNDLDTDNLIISSGGDLRLRQGAKVQVDAVLNNQAGGLIFGNGILEINGSDNFDNSGQIQAREGVLQVQRSGSAVLDLDGSGENGILVSRSNSLLVIDMPLNGPFFDGQVRILGGEVQINDDWVLSSNLGTFLEFDGAFEGDTTATLSGTGFTLFGQANVLSGTAVLAVPTIVTPFGTVDIADETILQFDAPTTVDDPISIVNGFSTTLVVNDIVNIGSGFGNFDWDGRGQAGSVNGTTIVNAGGALNIDVVSVDEPGLNERYSGQITMNSGSIDVQNTDGQWEHQGQFDFNNTNGTTPLLSGEQVLLTGNIDVGGTGPSRISAPAILAASSHVDVAGGTILELNGSSLVINGGNWSGNGEVNLDAILTTVTAATTVNMPNGTFDIDGSFMTDTLALNAPFTLNVQSLDSDFPMDQICNTVQINSAGLLDINFTSADSSYIIDGTLDLNALGGDFASTHLDGADVELAGTIDVNGNSISRARVDMSGSLNLGAGSSFNLNGGTFSDANRVFNSVAFNGDGELVLFANRALRAEDGSSVGVDLENRGFFEPGFSIGMIDLLGNYRQTNSGTVTFELAGSKSVQQDMLSANGVAILDGSLMVKLIDEGNGIPVLDVGDEFTVLTANGGVSGQFDNAPVSIGVGEGYQWEVIYSPNDVTIRVDSIIPNLVLGDIDGDGAVTLLDVSPFVDAINSGVYIIQADLNCDGAVNLLDVSLFVDLLSG